MDCEYRDKLVAYADGELDGAEARELHAHIETCADCRARLALLKRSYAALEHLGDVAVPEGFAARVKSRTHRRLVRMPFYAGGAVAVAATLLLMFATHGTSVRPQGNISVQPPSAAAGVTAEEMAIVQDMDVLENYDVLSDLDTIKDYDTIAALDELGEGAPI